MSQHMGVGPLMSPEKERQMREAAYHASLAPPPPPPPYHHAEEEEGDTMEGDQPQTLKEYYEQKRKMRERSTRLGGGGKLEVGTDGLLMSKEKKPPLRLSQNKSSPSTATNIDWSGY
jgi:hypothetical protein